jgi:hypothetical protein
VVDFVLERDYLDTENVPRAVQAAYDVIWALRRGEIDWALRREEIAFALQVLCDALGGSPSFAYNSVMLVQPDLRQPEIWESEGRVARAERRAYDLTIMAEVAHRCERYRQAVIWCQVALGELEAASPRGDKRSLLKEIASPKSNQLAGAVTATSGIMMPSVRRTGLPPQATEHYLRDLDPLIAAILASGQTYCRSDAFGSQGLFLEAKRIQDTREPTDGQLSRLTELRSVSEETRGNSKRSLATAPLVEMEFLRAVGDMEGAKDQASLARERLIDFSLPRHLDRMAKFRYLSFDG